MLFPLMDMFFILLLFFIVTSGFKPHKPTQAGRLHAIPRVGTGEAQILLQMIDENNLIWLDNTCFGSGWEEYFPGSYTTSITSESLMEKLDNYLESFGRCVGNTILIVIRAPDNLDWGDIKKLEYNMESTLESLVASRGQGSNPTSEQTILGKKIEFSLVEGSAEDIVVNNVNRQRYNEVEIKW